MTVMAGVLWRKQVTKGRFDSSVLNRAVFQDDGLNTMMTGALEV